MPEKNDPPSNLFSVSSPTTDVRVLMWRVERKLARLEAGESPGPLRLDRPPFGRSDEEWPRVIRDLGHYADVDGNDVLPEHRTGAPPRRHLVRRAFRRLTRWYFEPVLEKVQRFQRRAATGMQALLSQYETQSEDELEIVRELHRLSESVEQLAKRLDALEKNGVRANAG